MHQVMAKGILSSKNGMNIYRGCSHGCIYCDSRSSCYQMKHDFEDIEVKVNAPELLEESLRKKRKKCMVGTGAMTDPYLPLEKQLKNNYINKYGGSYQVVSQNNKKLMKMINNICQMNNILFGVDEVFKYLHKYEGKNEYKQLSLF